MGPKIQVAITTAVILTVGAGCSSPNGPVSVESLAPPSFGASDSVFTDEEVLAAAYTTFAGPQGFYSEMPAPFADPFYVSSMSVARGSGSTVSEWVELSTEDSEQAREWAVLSVPESIVDSGPPTVTFRYFEFATEAPGEGPRAPVRVHRASYLDRSAFDRFRVGEVNMHIGTLRLRPVDDSAARGVAEYLWTLSHRGPPERKVLTSFSRASQGSILHTIYFVRRVPATNLLTGNPGEAVILHRCDYRVDTATGEIRLRERDQGMVPSRY